MLRLEKENESKVLLALGLEKKNESNVLWALRLGKKKETARRLEYKR